MNPLSCAFCGIALPTQLLGPIRLCDKCHSFMEESIERARHQECVDAEAKFQLEVERRKAELKAAE